MDKIISKLKTFLNKQCKDMGNSNPKYEIKDYSLNNFKILIIKELTLDIRDKKVLRNYIYSFNRQATKFGGSLNLIKINKYNQADFDIVLFNDIKDKEEFCEQLKFFFASIMF